MSKFHPARSCGFVGNPTLFKHFCEKGFCEQLFHAFRTSATTVAHVPGPSSLAKKKHKVHMRAAAARAPRNPSKHIVISTLSRCDVKKTYENTPLSHPKMLKICPRAHAESFQNQWFFDIPIQRGFEGNFCAHLELLQQRLRACEGHHPLQKMTPSAHRRGRRARMSKSFQTHCHFNTFKMRCQENI